LIGLAVFTTVLLVPIRRAEANGEAVAAAMIGGMAGYKKREIAEVLISQGEDGMRPMLELLLNAIMKIERSSALGAGPYERSETRKAYANGYKDKTLQSRLGALELQVPKVRGMEFYPKCLEKGSRSERALKLAIAQMYLQGVSTRKVTRITKELCGLDITSDQVSREAARLDEEFAKFRERSLGAVPYLFLDATYLKVRHSGSIISMPCLIAYGVDSEGKRQILGASMSLSEAEVHWREFLTSLQKRGLLGLMLITSDDHEGLAKARQAVFPSVPWQRCQFHMSQNAQSYAPKKELRAEIAQAMRDIFSSPTLEMALVMVEKVSAQFDKRAPEIEEGFAVYSLPREHQKRLRTTNGLERVNREIKRRTRVAVMFPNKESALRLVTGVLVEIHEEWITGKNYLDMDLLKGRQPGEVAA